MSTPNPITSEEQIDLSIASTPQDIAKVPGLLNDIASLGSSHDLSIDRGARLALLEKARSLVTALETPRETMLKHTGAETASFVSIALGIDIGLFKEMAKNGGSAKPAPELAKALGINVEVLRRILRHLTAMKHINQTGADEYAPTNFALSLTHPFIADGYLIYRDVAIPPMLHFHAWLAKNSYSAPSNATESPFSFGHKTSSSMFEYMAARPAFQTQFNNLMQGYRLGRPPWFSSEVYPVRRDCRAHQGGHEARVQPPAGQRACDSCCGGKLGGDVSGYVYDGGVWGGGEDQGGVAGSAGR
ncbi:hypothetical protein QBC47DRAFT_127715 [Echria macrotheca]|uniref:O-methyltransferase n=1 Tax=Echria macrotheca TaxID=438768 RepID=A0AAJ0B1K1_9PEZI|nr:hypothetical protein QBC47DRAFT_127715 [Echria macrotheca]